MSNGKPLLPAKNQFEKAAWPQNALVVGIDEVGRGCLAGPVVTAAVILRHTNRALIKDSKLLNAGQLEKAATWISRNGWWAYGIVSPHLIDKYNIYQATLLAMRRAVLTLLSQAPRPTIILVDAMPLHLRDTPYADIPIEAFTQGESRSCSIAAASIMAKVRRDTLMRNLNRVFPVFALDEHKGYATKDHQASLRAQGASIIHRKTFLSKFTVGDESNGQQSLC